MRIRDVSKALLGSGLVYIAIAACGASDAIVGSFIDAGADDAQSIHDAIGQAADALADAVTSPVPDARAAGPEVATEACNKTYTLGSITYYYAEHAYPGATVADLAHVVALVEQPASGNIPGYAHYVTTVWVRDGAVAAQCGAASGGSSSIAKSVTFVRP